MTVSSGSCGELRRLRCSFDRTSEPAPSWTVGPDDPRAAPTEIWEQLTPEQRDAVVAALPSEFPVSELHPPEGDDHLDALSGARAALRHWFGKQRARCRHRDRGPRLSGITALTS